MKKMAFPKKQKTVDAGKDLGIEGYDGVKFVMWNDPSMSVIQDIIGALGDSDSEVSEDSANSFFESVAELIIDCNIEGLSFDTAEETQKVFSDKKVPWGFLSTVCVTYIMNIVYESEALKKALGLSQKAETSGEDKSSEE